MYGQENLFEAFVGPLKINASLYVNRLLSVEI